MKKKVYSLILIFISPFFLYFLFALILGVVQLEKTVPPEKARHLIYVVSSDIHTEFVLPLKNKLVDFSTVLPEEQFSSGQDIKFVSIGWGSKDFFFEMQTWDQLKFGVLFRSVFLPSESAVHVEYLKEVPKHELLFPLLIDDEAYKKLSAFILNSFAYDKNNQVQQLGHFSYYGNDRFYAGRNKYHLFTTCNEWTNKGLEAIGWRRPVWSPFKYAIEMAVRN